MINFSKIGKIKVVGSQKQERTIKILLYTTELANLIKGLLLKIKSPTPHNPTENFWFAPFCFEPKKMGRKSMKLSGVLGFACFL